MSETKPPLKFLREEAALTAMELAVEADVSLSTINRMETRKIPVTRLTAFKVLKALSAKLGRKLTIDDVDLNIQES